MMVLELLALLFTTAFAAIAVYVAVVEHPARLAGETGAALAQWRPSYRRAAVMQVVLAVGGVVSAIAAFVVERSVWALVGGLILGLVIPFTLIVILGTNKQLMDSRRDGHTPGTRHLLESWGRLHWVRTGISLMALAILAGHMIGALR
jgi:anthrone oxygenase-like protein